MNSSKNRALTKTRKLLYENYKLKKINNGKQLKMRNYLIMRNYDKIEELLTFVTLDSILEVRCTIKQGQHLKTYRRAMKEIKDARQKNKIQ